MRRHLIVNLCPATSLFLALNNVLNGTQPATASCIAWRVVHPKVAVGYGCTYHLLTAPVRRSGLHTASRPYHPSLSACWREPPMVSAALERLRRRSVARRASRPAAFHVGLTATPTSACLPMCTYSYRPPQGWCVHSLACSVRRPLLELFAAFNPPRTGATICWTLRMSRVLSGVDIATGYGGLGMPAT